VRAGDEAGEDVARCEFVLFVTAFGRRSNITAFTPQKNFPVSSNYE
jgi:hypothetical protein